MRRYKKLRVEFPDKLTMASTGTELTGDCEEDRGRWLRVTKKLEEAGAMGIEYSLSCPGTDGIDSLAGESGCGKRPLRLPDGSWKLQILKFLNCLN